MIWGYYKHEADSSLVSIPDLVLITDLVFQRRLLSCILKYLILYIIPTLFLQARLPSDLVLHLILPFRARKQSSATLKIAGRAHTSTWFRPPGIIFPKRDNKKTLCKHVDSSSPGALPSEHIARCKPWCRARTACSSLRLRSTVLQSSSFKHWICKWSGATSYPLGNSSRRAFHDLGLAFSNCLREAFSACSRVISDWI